MAKEPGNKVWPHLERRRPRFGADAGETAVSLGRRRIRRLLAGATLLVSLFAFYPILHQQSVVQRAEGVAQVTDCDRLAAHPADTQKLAPGVLQDHIDVARATRACAAALANQPHDARALYQMGRVALAAQDARGLDDMRQAADAGYAQAQFVLGLMLVRGDAMLADVCAGGQLWIKAARQRHLYSKLYLAGYWRDGAFKDCALAVTEPEIAEMLQQADDLVADPQQQRDLTAARVKWSG